jgi:hypothetical protein
VRWKKPDDEQEADGDNNQIIEVANNWDKVGYQVDWTQRIACDHNREGTNNERGFGVTSGEINSDYIALDAP